MYYSVRHLKEKSWRQFSIKWCSQQHTTVHKRPSLSECWTNAPSFLINDFFTIKHICCISPEGARKHWTTKRTHLVFLLVPKMYKFLSPLWKWTRSTRLGLDHCQDYISGMPCGRAVFQNDSRMEIFLLLSFLTISPRNMHKIKLAH